MASRLAPRRIVAVNDRGHVVGQDHHRAKLTDHDIWLIQELRAGGMSLVEIAAKFEINKGRVHEYCSGSRRGHIASGQRSLGPVKHKRRFRPAHPDEFDEEFA